ncbi:DUF5134 domain-containing protein [Solwaraspora sp. WMMB335]|uniref:DUF5134 domain-containing protein n=1 Tax=Solwaraspora sp. WMMB335 TaxID=3404118 RepID=UPI003B947DB4
MPWLRWLLTLSFAVTGGYFLARCWIDAADPVLRRRLATWISTFAHIAMSMSMIAMTWLGTAWDGLGLQAALFLVLGGWFGIRAVRVWLASPGPRSLHAHLVSGHEVVAMGAMAWMLLRMHHMPAGHPHVHSPPAGGTTAFATVLPSTVTVLLLLMLTTAMAGWLWTLRAALSRPPTRRLFGPAGAAGCHLLMSAGMAVSTATLL